MPGAVKPRDAEVEDREGEPVERREPSGAPEPERE